MERIVRGLVGDIREERLAVALVRVDEADELVGVRLRRVVALRQFVRYRPSSVNSDSAITR